MAQTNRQPVLGESLRWFTLFEDRRMNLVIEGARNFVDFDNDNASSFQVIMGLVFDLTPSVIGNP